MYGCYDNNNNLVAFHEDYNPVAEYAEMLEDVYSMRVSIKKIKKEYQDKLFIDSEDLYLIKGEFIYMRNIDKAFLDLTGFKSLPNKLKYAQQILYATASRSNLKKKQQKKLIEAIEVLDDVVFDDSVTLPSPNDVNEYMENVSRYHDLVSYDNEQF